MACEGAKQRRDGLIADMVTMRERVITAPAFENMLADVPPDDQVLMLAGYLSVVFDRLAAAVIALAGPCCEDCDDNEPEDPTIGLFQHMPKQGWSNPDHDVMADLREAHDGILADRDGASDE